MANIGVLGGQERLRLVRQLEAARRWRARLKAAAAAAWAAYYRAVDAAENGEPAPWGGTRPEVQANLNRLGEWAEAVEAEYRLAYQLEEAIAGAILWPEKNPESAAIYGVLPVPSIPEMEAARC